MSRRGSSWVIAWFVLGTCVPRTVEPSCENTIRVRTRAFEYRCYDIAPYALRPLGEDAVSDSIFQEALSRNYNNLARGLAIAGQIHRYLQANPEIAEQVARESGGLLPQLRQEMQRTSADRPSRIQGELPESRLDQLWGCVHESTMTLYSVQVGSFEHQVHAVARLKDLEDLRTKSSEVVWDSTRTVDWWNDACWGSQRPDLFILGPDEAPGPGYKVLHGMFVERRDAIAARDSVRQKFPATVISVHVTGRILRTALEHAEE